MENIKLLENVPIELKKGIIKSIQNAIGDDILLDVKNNELDTHNGDPTRTWDFINRNLKRNLKEENFITAKTKRGRWEMRFIVDKNSGILYTLMREERFSSLIKEVEGRKTVHYIQAIAETFNKGLKSKEHQLSLFKEQKYYNEDVIAKIVGKILDDLQMSKNIISNHAIVLFEGRNHELELVRCCIINSDLELVEESSWNEYIEPRDTVVMHEVKADDVKFNNPTIGLRYKQKAKNKIGQLTNTTHKEEKEYGFNDTKDKVN